MKHKIIFNGYNIIRTDRGLGSGGGTAIVLKNNIKYELINTIGFTNSFELTAIKIKTDNNQNLFIFLVYVCNPKHDQLYADLTNLLSIIPNNNLFIVGGDFNSRHVSWRNR